MIGREQPVQRQKRQQCEHEEVQEDHLMMRRNDRAEFEGVRNGKKRVIFGSKERHLAMGNSSPDDLDQMTSSIAPQV